MRALPILLAVTLAQASPPPTQVATPSAVTHRELVTTYSDGPQGFDRFAVTAVLWDDLSIEGDENLKTSVLMVAAGVNQQLRRVIALLQDPSIGSIADLRRRVEALPIDGQNSSEMIGQRQVMDAVLADLKAVPPRQSWRQDGIARYTDWLTRLR
jgi:hypothetical protein